MAEMKITLAKLLRAFRISATEETKLDCFFLKKYRYFEGNKNGKYFQFQAGLLRRGPLLPVLPGSQS